MKSFFLCALFGFAISTLGCATWTENIKSQLDAKEDKKTFQVKKLWVRDTLSETNEGFRKINRMTPIIYKDLIIQGNSIDGVVAFREKDGQKVWSIPVANGVEPSGALFKETLFISASDGHFYSIRAQTGEVLWKIQTQTENLGEPYYDSNEGVVYFQTGLSSLYSVDAESGRIIWTYARQDTSQFSIRGNSRPSVFQDMVYSGFSDGSLVAFNKKTGSVVWDVFLNRNKRFRDIDATPVVDGNLIYIQAFDDQLYCISATQGSVMWKVDFGGYYGVLLDQDRIYASTTKNQVVALNKKTGQVIWKYDTKQGNPTQVVTYKGMAIFGESLGKLIFLNAETGVPISSFEPGRGVMSVPAINEKSNRVYFISGEGNLYALEAGYFRPNLFRN